MTDKERLTNIIHNAQNKYLNLLKFESSILADHLLSNGVIVPPCYIGQEMWYLCEHYDDSVEIKKGKISMLQQKADKSWKFRITVNSSVWDFKVDDIGVRYFLTKEEAERELKKRGKENEKV